MFKIVALFFIIFTNFIFAHKVNIFIHNEGSEIHAKSYFTKSSPCKNCKVTIEDENGKFLTELLTNEDGEVAANVTQDIVQISVDAGSGHYEKVTYQMQSHTKTDEKNLPSDTPLFKIIGGLCLMFALFFGLYFIKRKK